MEAQTNNGNSQIRFFATQYIADTFCSLKHKNLTPQLVFAARFITLALIGLRYVPSIPFVSYLPNGMIASQEIYYLLIACYATGIILTFSNRFLQHGAFLVGLSIIASDVLNRSVHSNGHLFTACMLVLISLSSSITKNGLLKAQVIILYIGAFVNKAVDIDWWNGNYMHTLMVSRHQLHWYAYVEQIFPGQSFSAFAGIFALAIEIVIPLCFIIPRFNKAGFIIALAFHTFLLIAIGVTFGPFYFALFSSFLLFISWPQKLVITIGKENFATKCFRYFENIQTNFRKNTDHIIVTSAMGNKHSVGMYGWIMVAFSTPPFYYIMALLSRPSIAPMLIILALFIFIYMQLFGFQKKQIA